MITMTAPVFRLNRDILNSRVRPRFAVLQTQKTPPKRGSCTSQIGQKPSFTQALGMASFILTKVTRLNASRCCFA